MEKTRAKGKFEEKWDGVTHITKFAKQLDQRQLECKKIGAEATDVGKLQTYVESMWESDLFDDKEMNKWEEGTTANKTWTAAKEYFVPLYKRNTRITKERELRDDQKGHLDSTNSITRAKSSVTHDTTTHPPSEVSTMSTTEQSNLVDYCNNLEGRITSKDEQMTELKSKISSFEQRMEEQHKEMQKDRLEFMKMMKEMSKTGVNDNNQTGGSGGGDGDRNRYKGRSRGDRDGRYCPKCKKENQYHEPEKCWELEANKANRPKGWKTK